MANFSAEQVDLCLGDVLQDIAGDNVSAAEVNIQTIVPALRLMINKTDGRKC